MNEQSLKKSIISSIKWSAVTELAAKLILPITNMVLARLLTPETFGVVATVTMIISFVYIFADAGFQKYIVQHEFTDDKDLEITTNVAFWSNFIFSVLIWAVIAVFSESLAELVGNPGCGIAISVASFAILVASFSSIQTALYRRRFDFKTLFKIRIITSLIPFVITIPLALIFRNYWALIFGTIAKEVATAVILTSMSSWKPRLIYSFKRLKDMLSFSIWSMFEGLLVWVSVNIGIFIMGKSLSPYYVGLYKTSLTTVDSYLSIVTASTTPVLFSALSRTQSDDLLFRKTYYKFQRMVSIVLLPMGAGLYLYRGLVTKILLGSDWSEAADIVGLWALISIVMVIFGHYNDVVFRSKGKPKLIVLSQCLHLAFLIPVMLLTTSYGFGVLHISRAFARLELMLIGQIILCICFKFSPVDAFKNVFIPLAATFIMGGVGYAMLTLGSSILWQFISIGICAVIYSTALMIFPSMRRELSEMPFVGKLIGKLKTKKEYRKDT